MPGETVSDPKGALGASLADIDARVAALEKSNQWWPGMIAWTGSDVAPPGFLIADGSAFDVDRYAALAVIYPSGNLPNLIDRFPVGAGNLYAVGSTGGAAAVTLTAAQSGVPAHSHTATAANESAHTHGPGTGTSFVTAQAGGTGTFAAGGTQFNNPSVTAAGSAHTHTITVNNSVAANAASAHSILNPYMALTPLVKF